MAEEHVDDSGKKAGAIRSKVKETVGFWLQAVCALVLVKTVGVFGAITSFVSYFWLQEKIGTFGALVCSVVLGGIVGIGIAALMVAS